MIFLDDQSIPRARRLAAAEAQLRRQWCTPLCSQFSIGLDEAAGDEVQP